MRTAPRLSIMFLVLAATSAGLIGMDSTPLLRPVLEWLCAVNLAFLALVIVLRRRL